MNFEAIGDLMDLAPYVIFAVGLFGIDDIILGALGGFLSPGGGGQELKSFNQQGGLGSLPGIANILATRAGQEDFLAQQRRGAPIRIPGFANETQGLVGDASIPGLPRGLLGLFPGTATALSPRGFDPFSGKQIEGVGFGGPGQPGGPGSGTPNTDGEFPVFTVPPFNGGPEDIFTEDDPSGTFDPPGETGEKIPVNAEPIGPVGRPPSPPFPPAFPPAVPFDPGELPPVIEPPPGGGDDPPDEPRPPRGGDDPVGEPPNLIPGDPRIPPDDPFGREIIDGKLTPIRRSSQQAFNSKPAAQGSTQSRMDAASAVQGAIMKLVNRVGAPI